MNKILNKLRLIGFKLNLLRKRPINEPFKFISDFEYSYPWGRCLFKNEQQYYSDNNVLKTYDDINDIYKNLYKFTIKKEHIIDNGWWNMNRIEFDYSSGMLFSDEKFLYGSFEAEIFIPSGYGLWSAFWLFGSSKNTNNEDNWFSEIDIFEYYGKKNKFTYNTHAGVDYEHNIYGKNNGIRLKRLENSWHKYRLNWTFRNLEYYIDDKLVGVRSAKKINIPMSLIINMAIEKNIDNKLDKYLPIKMLIKNIKYYENC
jgi:beta-glucanase (GH16 family)